MKVVLFCGGIGSRIREYTESVPKPMIPLGNRPLLWHVMQYYRQFGHNDFVLCLGYKANIIKDFFLSHQPENYSDCVVTPGRGVELLGTPQDDWSVTMIDTGIWRNVGERLWAVREHVQNEEIFLANYSDGLSDVDLTGMIETFRKSDKVACFLAIRPPLTCHFASIANDGRVTDISPAEDMDLRINGGYFIFRKEIFDYMRNGEELVVNPFRRLMQKNLLMAHKYDGFWRCMDTLRDRQVLEDMIEQGETPWLFEDASSKRPVVQQVAAE